MPKIKKDSIFPSARFKTIQGEEIHVPSDDAAFAHLQFRRFAGCPICSMHLRAFAKSADELKSLGVREIIFFHSTEEALLKHEAHLPFQVVADSGKQYYKRYGVDASLASILHPKAMLKGLRGLFHGLPGMRMQNGPLGLPADILLDSSGRVLNIKYGKHAYDQWTVEELVEMVR